jgi:hypothetical protein
VRDVRDSHRGGGGDYRGSARDYDRDRDRGFRDRSPSYSSSASSSSASGALGQTRQSLHYQYRNFSIVVHFVEDKRKAEFGLIIRVVFHPV